MIILGIDPGYGRMGWAVVRNGRTLELIAAGCIETTSDLAHAKRLSQIAIEVRELLETHRPDRVVIEQLLFTKNQTTGIAVAEARGVVLAVAGAFNTDVVEVGPMQVKQAVTGYGHADKRQVQEMVARLLNLKKAPTPDDAADACAIAIAGSHR
ncbi:crossover junction endodeoxyribonuclease RuvC [Candidatus Uhrbacteria bacterium RIFCSPLOWO2_01_FULL_53_9]|uniref:Crossover junction endodeoxyribonuclease RuvC n=3 Tax=Candidatus Uhriibacteriota TaxID=1752732 RepID=A0A1F7UXW7_9BACT|nr:MAG: crossover junction endodeoxyribonuclease RuvC [Candidatus Uhrbacteria bacterium RIFCSPHIGHO2_02_FULL_53_13]OGL83131.1 MAG: crossover junction endodeoxyribonuclease RuvC [Candidatus Uhrbacteria bacterium RIFCSPLOWO2_01_FULL_53_9]OGL89823.1 MAG: crossover junction endodeoxyribonuclease RuvC [Candidatus Uhrbacteria bacterium RIFCSPLOWO2_02_FULL_53_10]